MSKEPASTRHADSRSRARRALRAAAGLGLFIALAAWATWPLGRHPATHVYNPRWAAPFVSGVFPDLYLTTWIVGWVARTLVTAPWRLFEAQIFYPAPHALAYAENMLGIAPLTVPVYWLSRSPVLAHQLLLLACFALSGLTMAALIRYWLQNDPAAVIGGVIFGFAPWRFRHLIEVQLQPTFYLPLVLLFASRYLVAGRRRDLLAAGATLLLQAASSYALAFPLVAGVLPFLIVHAAGVRAGWRRTSALLVACGAAMGLFALISLPYVAVHGQHVPSMTEVSEPEAVLGLTGARPASYWDSRSAVFLGRGALALAAGGLLVALVGPQVGPVGLRALAASLLAFAAPLLFLGMGPGGAGPQRSTLALLWRLLPGLARYRAAYRFGLPLALPVAVLGAGVVAACDRTLRIRFGCAGRIASLVGTTVAVVAVLREATPARVPMRPLPEAESVATVYRWLREHRRDPGGGALLEIPAGLESDPHYVFTSLYHGLPLVNGYSGYQPPAYPAVVSLAAQLPGAEAMQTLATLTGVRWLVVHLDDLPDSFLASWHTVPGLHLVGLFDRDALFAVEPPAEDWRPRLRRPSEGVTLAGTALGPLPADSRQAELGVAVPPELTAGTLFPATLTVRNGGRLPWPALTGSRLHRVSLEVAWLDPQGRSSPPVTVILPRDLSPGSDLTVTTWLRAPARPGRYTLHATVAQDGVGALTLAGGESSREIPVEVGRRAPPQ